VSHGGQSVLDATRDDQERKLQLPCRYMVVCYLSSRTGKRTAAKQEVVSEGSHSTASDTFLETLFIHTPYFIRFARVPVVVRPCLLLELKDTRGPLRIRRSGRKISSNSSPYASKPILRSVRLPTSFSRCIFHKKKLPPFAPTSCLIPSIYPAPIFGQGRYKEGHEKDFVPHLLAEHDGNDEPWRHLVIVCILSLLERTNLWLIKTTVACLLSFPIDGMDHP